MKYINSNIESITYDSDTFMIKGYVTWGCNFSCPYCFRSSTANKRESQAYVEEQARYINKLLINNKILEKFKGITIRLIGGEVCFFDIESILKQFTVPITTVGITTNFSQKVDYFKNLYQYAAANKIKLILNCSYHQSHHTFFENMLELTTWCRLNNYRDPGVTIVTNDELDTVLVDSYIKKGITAINVRIARNTEGAVDLENKLLEDGAGKINKQTNINKGSYLIKFRDGSSERRENMSAFCNQLDSYGLVVDGRMCDSGTKALFIYPGGDIYRGCCVYLHQPDKCIGNIADEQFTIPTDPILCLQNKGQAEVYRCQPCFHNSVSAVVDKEAYEHAVNKEVKDV